MSDTRPQHTPGPWRVKKCDGGYRRCDEMDHAVVTDDLITPCLVFGGLGWEPAGKANANLIAAAPDLLASLKRLRELTYGDNGGPLDHALLDAADAIEKAEGRAP